MMLRTNGWSIATIATIGLLAVLTCVSVAYVLLRIRIAFAREQIETFETLRSRALSNEDVDITSFQRAMSEYYPSGTKQTKGSDLDYIVESYRELAAKDLEYHISEQEKKPSDQD